MAKSKKIHTAKRYAVTEKNVPKGAKKVQVPCLEGGWYIGYVVRIQNVYKLYIGFPPQEPTYIVHHAFANQQEAILYMYFALSTELL